MVDLICSTLVKPFDDNTCRHFKREAFHAILDEEQGGGPVFSAGSSMPSARRWLNGCPSPSCGRRRAT